MITRAEPLTFLNSDGLRLEGRLDLPDEPDPVPGVVLCHPHPQYGGSMLDAVLHAVSGSLLEQGIATLRFNFRGVGASEGEYDGGAGEARDALAALETLSKFGRVETGLVGLAGYSFGAGVALRCAVQTPLVRALALIACPSSSFNHPEVPSLRIPKLLIAGSRDELIPSVEFLGLAERFSDPKEVHLVEGANHFFVGQTGEVGEHAGAFFSMWLRHGTVRGAEGNG